MSKHAAKACTSLYITSATSIPKITTMKLSKDKRSCSVVIPLFIEQGG